MILLLWGCPGPGSSAQPTPPQPPPRPPEAPAFLEVWDEPGRLPLTATLAVHQGALHLAIEHVEELAGPSIVDHVVVEPGTEPVRTPVSVERLRPLHGHLPVLAADVNGVHLVSKESVRSEFVSMELLALTPLGSSSRLPTMLAEHDVGRMQLALHASGAQLCWAGRRGETEQNVFALRADDLGSLASQPVEEVGAELGVVEDHCDIALDDSGSYLVYRKASTGQIQLQVGTAVPGALPLPDGHPGADLPSVDVDDGRVLIGSNSLPGALGTFNVWSCEGDCAGPADFVRTTLDPPGGVHSQVRTVLAGRHSFLFYVTTEQGLTQVELSSRCAGEDWVHEGPLLMPEHVIESRYTVIPGGSPRTALHDEAADLLRTVVLVRSDTGVRAVGWSASVGWYCPGSN